MPRRPLDDFDLFDREEDGRRMARREEMKRVAAAERAKEEEAAEIRRARATELSRQANKEALLRQYQNAGVAPPAVDAAGCPTCSLTMLLSMGWSVEEVGGRMELLAPAHLRGKIEQER